MLEGGGMFGDAIRLDGASWVLSPQLPASQTAYGLSLWFKTSHANGGLFSVATPIDANPHVQVYLEGGRVCAQVPYRLPNFSSPVYDTLCTWNQNFADGRWHHLAHTMGPNGHTLYVDGVLVGSGSHNAGDFAANQQQGVAIGRTQNLQDFSYRYFNGLIDDVRVFDTVLEYGKVQGLFNQPVLHLNFNQTPAWKDASSFANNGSCYSIHCPSRAQRGVSGKAASFDGVDYLDIDQDASLNLHAGFFTLAAWVYPRRWSTDFPQGILGYRSGQKDGYPTLQQVGRKVRFGFGTGDRWVDYTTPGNVLEANTWNHVVATFADGVVKIYVNGVEVAEDGGIFADLKPAATQELMVGRSSDSAQVSIDYLKVNDEGDGPGSAEVYLLWNGGQIWYQKDLEEGDEPDIDIEKTYQESATLEVWEDDKGDAHDDHLITLNFNTAQPGNGSQQSRQGVNGNTDVTLFYSHQNNSMPFSGLLDEVFIFNRPLDAATVESRLGFASNHLPGRCSDTRDRLATVPSR
jgi:hypothetical protein